MSWLCGLIIALINYWVISALDTFDLAADISDAVKSSSAILEKNFDREMRERKLNDSTGQVKKNRICATRINKYDECFLIFLLSDSTTLTNQEKLMVNAASTEDKDEESISNLLL